MKKTILSVIIMINMISVGAQVKVGNNPSTINNNAVFEAEHTSKGLLIPRLALTATSSAAPLSAHVAGMLVYNTATGGPGSLLTPGFYYNDGSKWIKITNDPDDVIVFSGSADPNSGATFTPNVPMDASVIYSSATDGSVWKYDIATASYISFTPAQSSAWFVAGTTNDAGANKTADIYRSGGISIGTKTAPDASAVLDVNSSSKGFLPPVMTQVQRNAITAPATGLTVYCTDCSNGSGCFNVNLGTSVAPNWQCLAVPGATVIVDCAQSSFHGTLTATVATTSANTVSFLVTNNSFSAMSGIDFSTGWVTLTGTGATGMSLGALTVSGGATSNPVALASGGSATLTYRINGTPSGSGPVTATFNKLGLYCQLTTATGGPAPTVNCAGIISNMSTLSYFQNGTAYTGTVTVPYTNAVAQAYAAETVTVNGITLTRAAGSFGTPSGNVVYNISGTYTGTTYAPQTFNINVDGTACSVVLGADKAFKTGTYTTSGNYGSCAAVSTAAMTDDIFTTGWGSNSSGSGRTITIALGASKAVSRIVVSGGNISCWGSGSGYNKNAGMKFQYWNGTAWVDIAAVPTLADNANTTYTLAAPIVTTQLRIINSSGWFLLGNFYPWTF